MIRQGLAATLLLLCVRPASATNVLLVVLDDVGADVLSGFTSADATAHYRPSTPEIDALGAAGLRFTQAWGSPACSPARATLQTGDYAFHHGVGEVIGESGTSPTLALADAILVDDLPAGTEAGFFGKWHLGIEPLAGDSAVSCTSPEVMGAMSDAVEHGYDAYAGSPGGDPGDYREWQRLESTADSGDATVCLETDHADRVTVENAVAWIDDRGADPWLAVVSFNGAHSDGTGGRSSWEVDDLDPACAADDTLHGGCLATSSCGVDGPTCDFDGDGRVLHDCSTGATDADDEGLLQYALYQAMVACTDEAVGDLLDGVAALASGNGLLDTLVVLVGDNGTPAEVIEGQYALEGSTLFQAGKSGVLESGVRVPLIVADGAAYVGRRPTFLSSPGRTVAMPVLLADVRETLGQVWNGAASDTSDGDSFVPCFRSTAANCGWTPGRKLWTESFPVNSAGAVTGGQGALRVNNAKLVVEVDGGCLRGEAFQLSTDPYEQAPLTSGRTWRTMKSALDGWVASGTGPTWIPVSGAGASWCP